MENIKLKLKLNLNKCRRDYRSIYIEKLHNSLLAERSFLVIYEMDAFCE